MRASEIRSQFLKFFEERGHRRVASSPVIPDSDPTLMFTNAGMVQFKRAFTGEEKRDYSRAATSQKCMRVSGKHNDLEEVGRSPSHQTFFEMLGNFSFGDYFKEEAIDFAWEFLTKVLGIPEDRLVVSVHEQDDEAFALWRDRIGLDESRIFRLDDKENFWQMGDTGPCGPCSEIHMIVDDAVFAAGGDPSGPGYVEIWNLVFMQFEQTSDGKRVPLPAPSVDTGMGLERISRVMQGVDSNYDTDLFQPLVARMAEIAGVAVGASPESDVSLQVVADHARACAILIGDGVLPSNEGRGYVLRRVLRRAARHGVLLGVDEPFLFDVAAVAISELGDAYPELVKRRAYIEDSIRKEEERFGRTLGRGLSLLDQEIAAAKKQKRSSLAGDVVFKLYDTFGFPTDLTEDILRGHSLSYDRATFDDCMREQSERARAAWKGSGQTAPAEIYHQLREAGESSFTGYTSLSEESECRGIVHEGVLVDSAGEGDRVEIVTASTPFYAESGGQVGDAGSIEFAAGHVDVEDTQRPVNGLVVHHGRVSLGTVNAGETVTLRVDPAKRAATVRNHSATHLMHWALREVLGDQVTQAGSMVSPERLRFDFTHDEALSAEEIRQIEDRVNAEVMANHVGQIAEKTYQEAIDTGAMAIFEEKYGDRVRVVGFGPSTELCGGTHASATGDIGSFRIVAQSAVGSGVRRVEAQTGEGAIAYARRESQVVQEAAQLLRSQPSELPERVAKLLERQKELERELEKTRADMRRGGSSDPLQGAREVGGIQVIASEVADASAKELRGLIDELKQRLGSGAILLATRSGDKAALAIGVTKDLTSSLKAGDLIREVAGCVGGSGGGRPDFAQAGGPNLEGIDQAIVRFNELIDAAMS